MVKIFDLGILVRIDFEAIVGVVTKLLTTALRSLFTLL